MTLFNKKLGIVLPSLYNSQLAYWSIKQVNKLISEGFDCCIFQEDIAPPIIKPFCGVFTASEMFNFDGLLIATTISSAHSVLKTIKPVKKIFYIWDLEWLRHQKSFLYNIKAYRDPRIELVVPSLEYQQAIKNYANREAIIIKDLNLKEVYDKFSSNPVI